MVAELGTVRKPPTPSDIVVFTPIASPPLDTEVGTITTQPTDDNGALHYTSSTPWQQFQQLISSLTFPRWKPETQNLSIVSPYTSSRLRLGSLLSPSVDLWQPQWASRLSMPPMYGSSIHSVIVKPSPYLPKIHVTRPDRRVDGVAGLSRNMTEAGLMKLLVGLISNNFETHRMAPLVMDLTEDRRYRTMLKDLLSRKLDKVSSVSSMAEKLLIPAVKHGRLDIVKMLVKSEVDVNSRVNETLATYSITALRCAVDQNERQIVAYLIDRGATDWNATFWIRQGSMSIRVKGTVLDLAIARGHYHLVEDLIKYVTSSSGMYPDVTVYTLRNTISLGRADIVQLLLNSQPILLEAAQAMPWIFYEAAAACEDVYEAITLVEMLRKKGLDMTATDASGYGSALAVASQHPNMLLVQRLIVAKFPTNGIAAGPINPYHNGIRNSECDWAMVGNIRGMSALHVAIVNAHLELVELLLNHGVDANQACGIYPIQRAALGGNPKIVVALIKAGVDVNSTYRLSLSGQLALPALQIAIQTKRIEAAKILYSAGATLAVDDAEILEQPILGGLFPIIVEKESQEFILNVARRWLYNKKITMAYLHEFVKQSGTDLFHTFTKAGTEIAAPEPQLAVETKSWLLEFCTEILAGNWFLVVQPVLNLCGLPGGVGPQYSTRFTMMAVLSSSEDMVKVLLRAGADPFELITRTEEEELKQLEVRYGLEKHKSAFGMSLNLRTWNITETFLKWYLETISGKERSFHYQQMCEAYLLALSKPCEQLRLLMLNHGINYGEIEQALGSEYVEKTLYVALIRAIKCQTYDHVGFILEHSKTCSGLINPSNRLNEHTPLQYLAMKDEIRYVRMLLDLGADVNASPKNFRGATALQFAAMNGHFEIASLLLDAGADVNAPPAAVDGRTAIEGAAEWGRLDMVHHLLEAGADVQNHSNYRRTVFRAWRNGHHTIARIIQGWKTEKDGKESCDSIGSVIQNMSLQELDFADATASQIYGTRRESSEYMNLGLSAPI
jgi:ankyrin repeat protein